MSLMLGLWMPLKSAACRFLWPCTWFLINPCVLGIFCASEPTSETCLYPQRNVIFDLCKLWLFCRLQMFNKAVDCMYADDIHTVFDISSNTNRHHNQLIALCFLFFYNTFEPNFAGWEKVLYKSTLLLISGPPQQQVRKSLHSDCSSLINLTPMISFAQRHHATVKHNDSKANIPNSHRLSFQTVCLPESCSLMLFHNCESHSKRYWLLVVFESVDN